MARARGQPVHATEFVRFRHENGLSMLYSFGTRPHAVRDVFKFDWTKRSAGTRTVTPTRRAWRASVSSKYSSANGRSAAFAASTSVARRQACSAVCASLPDAARSRSSSQATVAQYASSCLGTGDEHAADRPGLCANWAIREVEIALLQITIPVQRQQLVDVRARRPVPQHAVEHRTNEVPDLGERLGAAAPKRRGMLA